MGRKIVTRWATAWDIQPSPGQMKWEGRYVTRRATTWDIQHFLVTGHAALRGDRLYGHLSRLVVMSAVWVLLGPTQPATSVPRPQLNPVPAAF